MQDDLKLLYFKCNINYFRCAGNKEVRIMQQDLLEILVDIFKSSGYNVIISSHSDILVEKNGHQAYVKCAFQPDYEEIKNFSQKIGGCTGIYVMPHKIPKEFGNYAAELGIYLWDRDELALQIGRAVLTNIEGKKREPCFEPESQLISEAMNSLTKYGSGMPLENWRTKDSEIEQELYLNRGINKGMNREINRETNREISREMNREIVSFQGQPARIDLNSSKSRLSLCTYEEDLEKTEQEEDSGVDLYETLNIHSVEPRISQDQAINIVKPYLSNPKEVVLKFVPFWKYRYNVEAEKRFRSKVLSIAGEGKGFLNALNKSKEKMEIEGLSTPTRIPPVKYEIKRQNVDKKQAEKILLDLIIEENTRELRFNNMEGQAIIYEQRNIRPRPEEIRLDIELIYIPVWEVKGKRNSVEINAYNAKVLEEPIDEDAEFL